MFFVKNISRCIELYVKLSDITSELLCWLLVSYKQYFVLYVF
jgi:hypothetical protein